MNLNRFPNESELDWKYRLLEEKVTGQLDADWQDIIEVLDLNVHRDTLRKGTFLFLEMKEFLEDKYKRVTGVEELKLLAHKKLELQKERTKLASEKSELNKWLREQSRTESIYEKIEHAIGKLEPITPPTITIEKSNTDKALLVDLADSHFGRKGVINGLKGEVIAEYSVEIFKNRMWKLLRKIVEIAQQENITDVTVLNLSDSIDGLLRFNQLQFLQLGVLDQAMQYAEFMSEWLNFLSEYVVIDYRSVLGNHSEIRPLNSNRGDFEQENMERIIVWYIKTRLSNNARITVHTAEPLIYFDVLGTKIAATHGQNEKNLEESLKSYMMIYQVPIHILKTGHLHHFHNKTIGMSGLQNIEFVQSPSICGIDDYSIKLKRTSNAGSLFTVFEKDYGKLCTYDIRLK